MSLEPCIPPGDFVYLACTNLKVICIQLKVFDVKDTWYTKVKQMYEHLAYELRYEHLSSIEHGSICMKPQFI